MRQKWIPSLLLGKSGGENTNAISVGDITKCLTSSTLFTRGNHLFASQNCLALLGSVLYEPHINITESTYTTLPHRNANHSYNSLQNLIQFYKDASTGRLTTLYKKTVSSRRDFNIVRDISAYTFEVVKIAKSPKGSA